MAARPEHPTPLTHILVERIERHGPLTFAAFMEACLYHPEHGYYTRHRAREGAGDYFTSVDVGPVFARLLARQFREMWELLGRPVRFDLVECGAGRGRLASSLLEAVAEFAADFAEALALTLVEANPRLRTQAQAALEVYGQRVRVLAELPASGLVGCVFSNELLDAFPVHRVVQREGALREIYVSAHQGQLMETEGELSSAEVAHYLERFGAPLEVGQLAEVQLAALEWLERAAAALERSFLLTIDYGHRARELYGPGHPRGTLLAYRQHRAHEDWLAWPGEQDLTAHVNFTALEERGRELGLTPLGYTQQSNFLLALLRASGLADLAGGNPESELQAARQQLKQLIHPAGMGEAFKVLAQASGVADVRLTGFEPV